MKAKTAKKKPGRKPKGKAETLPAVVEKKEVAPALPSNTPGPLSAGEIETIKNTLGKGLTDDELKVFIRQVNRTGLDPFARQVYAIKRKQWDSDSNGYKEKLSIETSIDGFRLIAQRTGKYAGQVGPFWCGDNGKWVDVWVMDVPPKAAKVGVLRHGFTDTLWAVAKFSSYSQKKQDGNLTAIWKKQPEVQIAKCAEAQALRRAFPQELSGLYTTDEMSTETGPINTDPNVPQIEGPDQEKPADAGPSEGEIAAMFKEASDHLETAQNAKQLTTRAREYGKYPHYTPEMSKTLHDIYERRIKELLDKIGTPKEQPKESADGTNE